ncbi:utrophin-like [Stegostoma tigrinum]|uniref:utrophin-like n=1 Tax=Stegostoma tigrinum TaxID=3053191 RepID=UPI0028700FF7|nr:utrophin-like [Stegostoma tigrinum]
MCSCGLKSCGGHGSGTAVSSPYAAEPAPEERAQRIAKAVRKQSIEVKENWEQLKIRASNWQKQVEKALEKLQELQKVLDDLEAHVITAEGVHTDWQPVGDLLIDSLQDHIDKTTGKDYLQNLRLGFERQQPLFWRDNGNCRCWRMRDNNVWSWMKTAGQAAS